MREAACCHGKDNGARQATIAVLLLRLLKDVSDSRRKERGINKLKFSVFTQTLRISLLRSFPLDLWLYDPLASPQELRKDTGQLNLFENYLVQPTSGLE